MAESTKAKIHRYDLKTGWSSIADPFEDASDEDLKVAGFDLCADVGGEGSFRVIVYAGKEGRYLFSIEGAHSRIEMVMVSDLPSMIELIGKLGPMALACHLQEIERIAADLQELATGEHGPLEDAHTARWRRRKRDVEIAKQKKQKE